jgi:fructokinase
MRALVLTEDSRLVPAERPRPRAGSDDDVVLRIVQTGVCGTDRSVLLGKFSAKPGVIMGHEAVGRVVETGPGVTSLTPGDRVVVNPTLYCASCAWCRRGQFNFCRNKAGNEVGIDRDGAFAEFMRLEERFLHRLPEDIPDDRAVLVEPLACVLNNLQAAAVTPGDRVVVLGAGPIGVTAAVAADHFGCSVRLVETDAFRRSRCRDVLGAFPGCRAEVTDTTVTDPRSADVVVDTVGSLLPTAITLADDLGRIVVMGFDDRAEVRIRPLELVGRGLRLIGAGDYNMPAFARAVDLARNLPLENLVTQHFGLDDVEQALDTLAVARDGTRPYTALKVVIRPEEAS